MARALSKKQRFEIFKRDAFTCQYCGRTPPAVVLEYDHIKPVIEGGSDDEHNLITSCFDCNPGKGGTPLGVIGPSTAERAARLAERLEQSKAYETLLRRQKRKQQKAIEAVCQIYQAEFPEWALSDSARNSIKHFLEKLPEPEVLDAMTRASLKCSYDHAFKYFCGICWRKIKSPD